MTREIQLTQGKVALVDDDDYGRVAQYKWYALWAPTAHYYVAARRFGNGALYMHRLITNAPDGKEVDHINHNALDNRKANLRICSRSENQHNRSANQTTKTSPYKGVHLHTASGKWEAAIRINGRRIYLGVFNNPAMAAVAYDEAARRYHGAFAVTNFKEGENVANCEVGS